MWQYLAMGGLLFLPAAAAAGATHQRNSSSIIQPLWVSAFALLVIFVGLRHNVGMDWNNYLVMMWKSQQSAGVLSQLSFVEPGYALILITADITGYGIYAANLLSAMIIFSCIFYFARKTPEPWLALVVSYPFFIMVFTMSANRQALAAGAIMVVLAHWNRWSPPIKVIGIMVCASFHYSALIFLVFVALDLPLRLPTKIVATAFLSGLALYLLVQSGNASRYQSSYIDGAEVVESTGAVYHVLLNAAPAALYFIFPRARATLFPSAILRNLAFATLLCLPLALTFSTVASRLNFYWVPMAMYVLAAMPGSVQPEMRSIVRLAIGFTMLAVAVLWLQYANSAIAYLPYQNAIWTPEIELEYTYIFGR